MFSMCKLEFNKELNIKYKLFIKVLIKEMIVPIIHFVFETRVVWCVDTNVCYY